jgi:hypothetical protein
MATRTAKLYQGEDMTPVLDYTDLVIWEESEFGTRAWLGEGNASTVVIRDPLGEQGNEASLPAGLTAKSLASKNLFVIQLDTDYMFRGRVGIKNYSRDSQHVERYRQVECSLHDTNWDLDHIFVHNYVRPAETDIARVQGVIASYLAGSPRESTVLNGSNFLSGSNTVSLPANTYTQTSPLGVIREVAVTANKQFFVTGDSLTGGSLFYDGNDSTAYQAGIRISDRHNEIDASASCESSSAPTLISSVSGTWGATSDSITVPAGLVDSAFIIAVPFGVGGLGLPVSVNWTTGGTDYPATLVKQSTSGIVGLAIYRLLSPVAGFGTLSTSDAKAVGVWLLSGVDQTTPISAEGTGYVFAAGTGTVSAVSMTPPAGTLLLDAVNFFDEDFVDDAGPFTITPTGGQTEDWQELNEWPGPGHPDQLFAGGHGDASPGWTGDQSRPYVAFVAAVNPAAASEVATFPPIWNVGPSSTEDGSEQLCEVRLFWGSGTDQFVTAHSTVTHTQYGHSSETFTDDTIATEAEAQTKANSILAHRRFEDKTYNVTIGPLTDAQVLCVKHGQLIQIKARAIPDADDAFRTMRIAQCRYTTPVIGVWFAHLQLGRPWKMEPYSKGPPLAPKAAGSGDTPEPLGLTGSAGTDSGTFANDDHIHAHGTFGTNDLHTEYVREAILTTAGDMPYATGASVWTRLPIGGSNTHLVSSGVAPLWAPSSSGSPLTVQDEGTPLATDATTLNFVGAGVTATGAGATKTITIPGDSGTANVVANPTAGTVTIPGLAIADRSAGGGSDDEFDTTDTSDPMTGWMTVGTPTAHNMNSTALSHYYLKKDAAAGIHVAGIQKASPSLPFTVTAKLSDAVHSEGSARAQLMIGVSPPGAMVTLGYAGVSAGSGLNWNLAADNWTNPTTYGSVRVAQADVGGGFRYFRFVCAASTDVTMYVSKDGLAWWVYGTANFNPGFTIGAAGLIVNRPASGAAVELFSDWIRFT